MQKEAQLNVKPVIHLVDAICGSGKSHALKEHFITLSREGKRFILALPTNELCAEVYDSLLALRIDVRSINSSQGSATNAIISAMGTDEHPRNILCTHAGLLEVCKQATFNEHLQELMSQFDVFIDEVPDANHGNSVKIHYDDRMSDNFPFLQWIEDRNGLHYIKPDSWDDFYLYYTERSAAGDDLKDVLYCALSGAGILIREAEESLNARYISYTANPVARCAEWANSLTVSGAGVTRSDFVWWAENALQAVFKQADHLMPDVSRRAYPNKRVTLLPLMNGKATLTTLANVFKDHMSVVKSVIGENFIYASNKDKKSLRFTCEFSTLADEYLAGMSTAKLSLKSHGLNSYQDFHKAVFLGASNLNNILISDIREYATLSGYDAEELETRRNQTMNYEQAYQFVSRCSIRNFEIREQQVYIVPDLACAEYLKAHYFPSAKIDCLELDRAPKERKQRATETKPRNTNKGVENRDAVLSLLAQGKKQSHIVAELGLTKGAVSKIVSRLKADGLH